jgi:hypothetical protein
MFPPLRAAVELKLELPSRKTEKYWKMSMKWNKEIKGLLLVHDDGKICHTPLLYTLFLLSLEV